jgi:hypothetical protein
MAVGEQATTQSINATLTSLSTGMRNICQQITWLQQFVTELGTAGLESLGYSPADAATVIQMVSYLNTVAGVFGGTVQQGGQGGTGAIFFDFANALAGLSAGT